jgi:flagellar assembly protein FliH
MSLSSDYAFEQLAVVAPPLRTAASVAAPPEPPPATLAEVEDILGAARAEAEEIRERARLEGHAEGYGAGLAKCREDVRPAAEALAVAVEQIRGSAAEGAERLEREAAELGVHIAEKVLAGALEVQPWRVMDVVRGALRDLVERERVAVLVNPADTELVREAVEALRMTMGGIDHIEVVEERRVHRGGAVVRGVTGEVDGRIETKLQRVREIVEAELRP